MGGSVESRRSGIAMWRRPQDLKKSYLAVIMQPLSSRKPGLMLMSDVPTDAINVRLTASPGTKDRWGVSDFVGLDLIALLG